MVWSPAWSNAPGETCGTPSYVKYSVRLVVHVVETVLGAQGVDFEQCRFRVDRAGRVVRRDGDNGPRSLGDRRADRVRLQLVRGVGRHRNRPAAGDRDRHVVIEIERRLQDHFVARVGHGEDGIDERHVPASRHDHATRAVRDHAVLASELGPDGLDECRGALHRPVAVIVRRGGEGGKGGERLRGRPVGHDALAERDGAWRAADEIREDGDDGRLHRLHASRVAHGAL